MSVSLFEVKGSPEESSKDRFIYTLETKDGEIIPFSALTLQRLSIPPKAEFEKLTGSLPLKPGKGQIVLKKGFPYILSSPQGSRIAWWLDGKFTPSGNFVEAYPLLIPRSLQINQDTQELVPYSIKYPPYGMPNINDSVDDPGSPAPQIGTSLPYDLAFLSALFEAYLRREYKLYQGITCPEKFHVNGQSLPLTPFPQIQNMMGRSEIERFEQNPMFQPFAG